MLLLYLLIILSLINIFYLGEFCQENFFLWISETRLLILLLLCTLKKLIFGRLNFLYFRGFLANPSKILFSDLQNYTHMSFYVELVSVLENNNSAIMVCIDINSGINYLLRFSNFATTCSFSTMSTSNKIDEYSNRKRVHPTLSNFEWK